jgi:UDP-N-acetylmuramoyl-L-alanyl-D-glutamate--2,6-diaminopimelate ligase
VGHRTGTIGTIGIHVLDEALPSARTTPEAPDVHAVLAVMRERRHRGGDGGQQPRPGAQAGGWLTFDLAVFTNLSQDHLDFHATMAEYFDAKRRLFQPDRCRAAVICTDDAHGRELADEVTVPVTTYGVTGRSADWVLADVAVEATGRWAATAVGPQQQVAVSSPLPDPSTRPTSWERCHRCGGRCLGGGGRLARDLHRGSRPDGTDPGCGVRCVR